LLNKGKVAWIFHDAQLEIRSETGRGTTIVVHVPMNERN
jgi:hypothetical protein